MDADGELSLPEIERMVVELYGIDKVMNSRIGKDVLQDVSKYAEDRGGVLNLNSFSIYTMNHSMLLFPIFRIQRTIQQKIMGIQYWNDVERKKISYFNKKENKFFDPRHVQILLRTYKTGAAAAILTHTGDPNVPLKQQFDQDNGLISKMEPNVTSSPREQKGEEGNTFKYDKLKKAVEKIKLANAKARSRENVSRRYLYIKIFKYHNYFPFVDLSPITSIH